MYVCINTCRKFESENLVTQSCPTLCDPMDCNPPGSSVHGIFQARVLEWVAISFSIPAEFYTKVTGVRPCIVAPKAEPHTKVISGTD